MDDPFSKSDPSARQAYEAVLKATRGFGKVTAEEKRTSVHLVGGKSAFAGVHPRKSGILLNIRSSAPIESPRIRKVEKVSANRFHNEMLVGAPAEVDGEVLGWLRAAYNLSSG
jgi:hypothetical protein